MNSWKYRIFRKLSSLLGQMKYEPLYLNLLLHHTDQFEHFLKLREKFNDHYRKIRINGSGFYVTPLWKEFNSRLEASLLPEPSTFFLRDRTIASTMVITKGGRVMKMELNKLRELFSDKKLEKILKEDPIGHPRIASLRFMTSHNSIHHAYHISRFMEATKKNITDIDQIIEWGGGYGNLVKIYIRMSEKMPKWIIIDTPLMSTLQWLYLSSVFGEEYVRLITSPDQKPLERGITLLPVQWYTKIPIRADLFISTWAISETPVHLQNSIAKQHNWFGAKHLLIGYQESNVDLPDAGHAGDSARESGALIENIPEMPGQYYAFK